MDYNIVWWIKSCVTCQRRAKPHTNAKAPSRLYVSGNFNECVAMDIVGAVKDFACGFRYVMSITDHFTKYSRTLPLRDMKARTVADAFIERWIHDFQQPMRLHTDKGPNFESELIHQLCDLYGIERTRRPPAIHKTTHRMSSTISRPYRLSPNFLTVRRSMIATCNSRQLLRRTMQQSTLRRTSRRTIWSLDENCHPSWPECFRQCRTIPRTRTVYVRTEAGGEQAHFVQRHATSAREICESLKEAIRNEAESEKYNTRDVVKLRAHLQTVEARRESA